ncbi:MAG: DNA polymerase I [Phycisphaerae bacterium]|nr:DNA polymerase I [Phycisphaerae bacterium]
MPETLYLIDGHAQIYRCYYAPFRDLNAPSGEPTRATHVFCQMLFNLAKARRPTYLAMVMDPDAKTIFRLDLYDQYKANREPPPDDLAPQQERIVQIVRAAGIPIFVKPGFEADDLIATVARRVTQTIPDVQVNIVSRDKDLEQLLSDRVVMYDPGKDEVVDSQTLQAKKGYQPAQAVDIQTLTGDSTDNIPGVPGIGPKTAAKLIAKYGSADAVLAHADELTPKQKENVRAFAPQMPITRRLVTLRDDVEMDFDLDACRFDGFPRDALDPIFEELGFDRLRQQLAELDPSPAPAKKTASKTDKAVAPPSAPEGGLFAAQAPLTPPAGAYEVVDSEAKLTKLARQLAKLERFAFDTETTSLLTVEADLVGLSVAWEQGRAFYVPVRGIGGKTIPPETVVEVLGPIFADPNVAKCGHNLKYDVSVLRTAGIDVRGADFDSLIASYVLDSSRRSHSLDALSLELFDHRKIPTSDLIGKGKSQITMDQVEIPRLTNYACEDADFTWRLCERFRAQFEKAPALKTLFTDTEIPLVEVLADMEYAGVALDTELLAGMSKMMADRLAELTEQIHGLAGRPFNIDSTKQLAEVLFDDLGLPVIRKTMTGRSTDAAVLTDLVAQYDSEIARRILQYRELSKLKGTYVDALPALVCPRTGRVHTSFHQTGTITGRLSSSDPNLQNIPNRTEIGRQIRRAFVPGKKGYVLLTADYSQIELRLVAHFSGDENLRKAFAEDQDIHRFVAAQVAGIDPKDVTKDQRGRAKAVNFGIIYGQGAFGLSRQTGMSVGEARGFIDMYFMRYHGVRAFIDECIAKAKCQGYVETILGRRRVITDINARSKPARAAAERLAVNTVVQGSAADLIKKAMINIYRRIRQEDRPSRMLIQVHDELVFELPKVAVDAELQMVRQEMESAMSLTVPLKVDVTYGENWLETE